MASSTSSYPGEGAPALTVPTNMALLVMAHGREAQHYDPGSDAARSATDAVHDHLDRLVDNCTTDGGVWGNLGAAFAKREDASAASLEEFRDSVNDVGAAAALVDAVLVGCTGAAIVGGVSETRFHYEEMRAKLADSRNMPATWKGVRVASLAGQRLNTNALVRNDVPFSP